MTDLSSLISHFRSPAFPGSYFLSLEGIEGAGKSTQLVNLKNYLEGLGMRVIVLREPGGTSFGERLRQAVLQSTVDIHPLAESYLFASSRAQLLHEVVLKELATPGTTVIMDRYIDSSIAYQGVARKLGVEAVLEMHCRFPLHLTPHMTFYLRVSPEISMQRQRHRGLPQDYFESRGEGFLKSLVEGYDTARQLFPERIRCINGETTAELAFAEIRTHLHTLLEGKRP